MTERIEIRHSVPSDLASIEAIYGDAFPDEDLVPLVRELLKEDASIVRSLVGMSDRSMAGHGIFTTCGINGAVDKVALLAPLAVAPPHQRQGIGQAIVRAGLKRLEQAGISCAFVLGDPAYYGRFGFRAEDRVEPPYALVEEWRGAWQSLGLGDGNARLQGRLSVPEPWLRRALWEP